MMAENTILRFMKVTQKSPIAYFHYQLWQAGDISLKEALISCVEMLAKESAEYHKIAVEVTSNAAVPPNILLKEKLK